MQGETDHKVIFAQVQAGEADAGDGHQAGFLWEHLDVAERLKQRHVLAGSCE
jgi:hypothetical protein